MRNSLPLITASDCRGCGACCRHVGHPMFLRYAGPGQPAEPAWRSLPRRLKREVLAYLKAKGPRDDYGEPCIWLEPDGTCRHYEHRPRVCRDFEAGEEDCLRFRREQGIGRRVAGMNA